MKHVRKKFLIAAVSAIAGLLIVLLTIINLVGFTMASEDADRITEMLSEGRGEFPGQPERPRGNGFGPMGPMGPDSPEMRNSVRYFTVSLNENGGGKVVSFNISAVSEKEAVEWAESLKNETTGWTRGTYRYRVYRQKAVTYVTVIDQGRELLSCYRILMISVIGGAMGILISFLILLFVGRKLFAPVEEADRKQKQFIERAEREMKVPLTVIDADVEILERAGGPSEETTSIRRETRKMAALVENMDALRVVETSEGKMKPVSLSALVEAAVNAEKASFSSKGITLTDSIIPELKIQGDEEKLNDLVCELLSNSYRFGQTEAFVRLGKNEHRIILTVGNDTDLPDGQYDQAFDRFSTLSNAGDSAGLGLARVKEIVKMHGGRASAFVKDGRFTVEINF